MVAMNMAAGEPDTQYKLASGYITRYVKSGNNFARGMAAKQISTAFGGVASRAVDGNASNNWSSGSMTRTGMANNPWWEVKFGRVEIGEIKITLCDDRWMSYSRKNIRVTIYDGNQLVWSYFVGNHDPGKILTLHPKENEQRPFKRGDRVRVWRIKDGASLLLGEVECYAMVPSDTVQDKGTSNGWLRRK